MYSEEAIGLIVVALDVRRGAFETRFAAGGAVDGVVVCPEGVILAGTAKATGTSDVYTDRARRTDSMVKGLVMSRAEIAETPIEQLCELDRRCGNGIDVVLVWEPATNHVFVGVIDQATGSEFAFEVDPANALDAFYHPFAYEACSAHDSSHDQRVAVEI